MHQIWLIGTYVCFWKDRWTGRQTDWRVHKRPTPKQNPSDFIGGKPVLSREYLVSCSRTQRSASGEARSRNPSISGQALYHDCAPQVGSILCGYDTCPTQYAPDLRRSILCMQGTQYAPRESILCMEHFVALQSIDTHFLYVYIWDTHSCKCTYKKAWLAETAGLEATAMRFSKFLKWDAKTQKL